MTLDRYVVITESQSWAMLSAIAGATPGLTPEARQRMQALHDLHKRLGWRTYGAGWRLYEGARP